MDCSLPGSSVHEIFQARVLEWVAITFSNTKEKKAKNTKGCLVSLRILQQITSGCVMSSGEGNGTPFQYSCLENLMDGGA